VDPAGTITTIAGTGTFGFSGDGGPATAAQLAAPGNIALDAAGNLYIVDVGNHRIRKIAPSGLISTVAGTGATGFSGDGGPAIAAPLAIDFPPPTQTAPVSGLAVDQSGTLYIADTFNRRVRKVDPAGVI